MLHHGVEDFTLFTILGRFIRLFYYTILLLMGNFPFTKLRVVAKLKPVVAGMKWLVVKTKPAVIVFIPQPTL